MKIQEEIREGVRQKVDKAQGYVEGCCPIDAITDEILKFLDSKKVRIVDSWWDLNKTEKVFEVERLIDD